MIDIKPKINKDYMVFARVDEQTHNQILILERKHKINKSTVIRSLIEAGLKQLK